MINHLSHRVVDKSWHQLAKNLSLNVTSISITKSPHLTPNLPFCAALFPRHPVDASQGRNQSIHVCICTLYLSHHRWRLQAPAKLYQRGSVGNSIPVANDVAIFYSSYIASSYTPSSQVQTKATSACPSRNRGTRTIASPDLSLSTFSQFRPVLIPTYH